MKALYHSCDRRHFLKWTGMAFGASWVSGYAAADPSSPPGPRASPKAVPTGLVSSPEYKKHLTGPLHPESPKRIDAIAEALEPKRLGLDLIQLPPRPAMRDEILYCHTHDYYDRVKREVESGASELSSGDTTISRLSFDIALLAAGGALTAIDAIMSGRVKNVFCALRPPGHHACPAKGMGFCVFNNVAIGARYAQKKHNIGKVLIVDWDVHHGNGTQHIFYEDGSVFYFSTHQWPFYPGTGRKDETGAGRGANTNLNCPFPAGAGRKEIMGAFQDELVPAADRFKPELILISAGFDSRIHDPLGGFKLQDKDFADLTAVMMNLAARHANGRLVSVLEGGYNLEGLAKATSAHVMALATG